MATSALDRLLKDGLAAPVTAEAIGDTLGRDDSLLQLLFFTGDPAQRPETQDVSVVLRELKRQYGALVSVLVVARADETRLQAAFDVRAFPSVVIVQDGQGRDVIPRIQDWAVYAAKVRSWLGGALGAAGATQSQGAGA
jgi:hydrogenase-1 operon protein HyaE